MDATEKEETALVVEDTNVLQNKNTDDMIGAILVIGGGI